MKMHLVNAPHGLIPAGDADYENKKRLKLNEVYVFEVKRARNYQFHCKYFALLRTAWEYLPEQSQAFFGTLEAFRETIEVSAGYYRPVYNLQREEWLQVPKSIAFDKMTPEEFEALYDGVKDVLFIEILADVSQEEFERNLINF